LARITNPRQRGERLTVCAENGRIDNFKIMSQAKIFIRFFDDREVRAVWDEENAKWWFSVLDIVAVLTDQNDYTKTRNYWKYIKAKLKKENSQVVSATTQLKFLAQDGKKRLADMLDYTGIIALGKEFPGKMANRFIEWFSFSDESIDGKSKSKAYALFESSLVRALTNKINDPEMFMKGIDYSYYYEEND
jgi:cell filamentation protein